MAVDLLTLSSDEMEGRETGQKGEKMAADYITSRFEEIGLIPKGEKNTYFQTFRKKLKAHPHAEITEKDPEIKGTNIIGFIDNGAPNTVVIGAHYDHLGYGDSGSLHVGERAIHNGADDNASGVIGLLYLAESLKKGKFKNNNYLFIAFSGEEKGLLGSNFFINNPTVDKNKINYMINMDMIGRLSTDKKLLVGGIGTSPVFEAVIDEIKKPTLHIKKEYSGVGASDHMSFYNAEIPVLSFFTGQHEDYHKPSDDAHLINYSGLQTVGEFIYFTVGKLDSKGKVLFTKTNDPAPSTRTFTVTLGVMPDYLFDGKGMRLDGVRDGKPASTAGLEKGDIVIQLADQNIEDMQSYMKALATFVAGQTVIVTFIRDGQTLQRKVTF
ncbi:MAG: M20/M25/M40 family metallo-hydrolase [Saprospiraceae bacterium]